MFISSMILEQPRNNPLGMNVYFTTSHPKYSKIYQEFYWFLSPSHPTAHPLRMSSSTKIPRAFAPKADGASTPVLLSRPRGPPKVVLPPKRQEEARRRLRQPWKDGQKQGKKPWNNEELLKDVDGFWWFLDFLRCFWMCRIFFMDNWCVPQFWAKCPKVTGYWFRRVGKSSKRYPVMCSTVSGV